MMQTEDIEGIPSTLPSEYVDLSLWSEFQNSISAILNIPLAIHGSDGTVLAPPSGEDDICSLIKEQTARGEELYRDSYRKAVAKAMQRSEPYIYKCYTNQHIFVVPVLLDSSVSVAIVGGYVYLSEDDFKEFAVKGASDFDLDKSVIHELEKRLKIVQPDDFFAKPNIVKTMATPFLKSLYLKGRCEKRYHQIHAVIEATVPNFLSGGYEEDIYRNVFNTTAVLFDVDSVSIMERYDRSIYHTVASFGRKNSLISNWAASDSLNIIKDVVQSRRPAGCDIVSEIRNMGLPEGITSVYIFPMAIGDNVFGMLCVFNTRISTESAKLLTLLSNQLSFVLEGIRADKNIKKKFKVLEAMEDVYSTIAPVLDQEELHNAILDKATELVGAEQGSIMMLDNNTHLAIKASKGIRKGILEGIKVRAGEGISGSVIEKGTPVIVKDIEAGPFTRKNRARYKTKSFVSIPLRVGSRTIGVINISDKITGEVFSEEDLYLLLSFASYASIALERGAYYRMTEDLKKISVTDSLTELFNRRYFHERLFEEIERSKRHNEPFTIFMLDIDDFKVFNDKYGHLSGDEVLKSVAYAVRDAVRSIDVAARFGGEEFSIILPYTTKMNSYVTAERIRRSVEDIRFIGSKIPSDQKISISIGIAEFPADASSIEELIDKADTAMYLAKARGKNRIVGYGQ